MSDVMMMLERSAYALGNAVVQSVWQCALVGAVAAAVVMCVRRASVRYGVWCFGLLGCAAWFALTFVGGVRVERPLELAGYAGDLRGGVMAGSPEAGSLGAVGAASVGLFEIVALLWLCGFAFVSVRFVMQWRAAWLLRTRGLVAVRAEWASLFDEVLGVAGVSRRVCLRVSARAQCPMVVGVVAPVVVVPASVMLMMSPAQVRMVLAHELAHVRRYDHVVNMVQVLIETVLFYHPVVWWMSRQARVEREHCCDDAAVRMCGDAVAYARALTELEEVRLQSRAVLGLQGGSLMKRVQRIVSIQTDRRVGVPMRVMAFALVASMIVVAACTTGMVREDVGIYESYEALQAAVESGEITPKQARVVYERELLPDTWLASRCADERAYWVEQLNTYDLSEERLAKTLDAMERDFNQRIEKDFRTRVLGRDGREVALALYREELEWCQREEGLSDAAAERMYAKRVEEMNRPAIVINLPDSAEPKGEEGMSHHMFISPNGDSVDGTPVQLVDGNKTAGVFQVKENVPEGSAYEPGQRIRFTPGMPTPMYRAMIGKSAEELWIEQNGAVPGEAVDSDGDLESKPQGHKLNPMDDAFWHHQGIRPLSAYDESFREDC